jgi:type I restriction enzyme, S subunit
VISRDSINGAFPKRRLGEVVEFLDSQRRPVTEADRRAGPYPYYGANGQQGTIDDFIFDEPLVLLAEDGGHFGEPERGIAYRISGKTWVNNHAHVLRTKSGIDLAYLCRVLENYDVTPFVTGTTRGKLTKAGASELVIPLPSLKDQQRIAEVLDRAEALRAKRRAAVAELDSLTQSIFLDLFGDPGENAKGWPVRTVADYVAEFQGGKSIESESGDNVITRNRVLKVSAVTGMKLLVHESKPVPDSYEPPKEHFAKPGDLLFSRANTTELVGAVAYVESTPPNILLPDKLWRFVWRQPAAIEPLFVWALFQTPTVRWEIGRRATGTSGSMKNISQEKVFGIRTILPPIDRQREFAHRVRAVEKLKTAQRASLAEVDALFASLQHRAFRGEL